MANFKTGGSPMTNAHRDIRLVITTRALRTFGYGCTSVLLAGMLDDDGVTPGRIGMVLASAAAGCVTASVLMDCSPTGSGGGRRCWSAPA